MFKKREVRQQGGRHTVVHHRACAELSEKHVEDKGIPGDSGRTLPDGPSVQTWDLSITKSVAQAGQAADNKSFCKA